MKVICITGGIGSGKTIVSKIIATMGYPVYHSDERAKKMYFLPEVKEEVIKILGKQAYLSDNEIDKKYIATKIFSDKELLSKINKLIHTAVKKDFEKFIDEHKGKQWIFKESALIFESGLFNTCDKIILVTAPVDVKIERIKKRDGLGDEEIIQRMKHQWNDDKKLSKADFVINNDGQAALLPQVLMVLDKLKFE